MIQTSQSIGDAPYGDYFTVEVRNPRCYNVDVYLVWNFPFFGMQLFLNIHFSSLNLCCYMPHKYRFALSLNSVSS